MTSTDRLRAGTTSASPYVRVALAWLLEEWPDMFDRTALKPFVLDDPDADRAYVDWHGLAAALDGDAADEAFATYSSGALCALEIAVSLGAGRPWSLQRLWTLDHRGQVLLRQLSEALS